MKEYKPKIEKELLEKYIPLSKNYTEVLNYLGKRSGGNNHKVLKNQIEYYNLNISHFETQRERAYRIKEFAGKLPTPLEDILIDNSKYSSSNLKKRLYKEGLKKAICELCGQDEFWNGKQMSLILDHINGKHYDNRLENLRIVCPNCNATLDTHCSKNKIIKPPKYKPRSLFFEERKDLWESRKKELINNIKNSNIDFKEYGWRIKLSKILNKTPQHLSKFIKENIPEIWEICNKHSK